MNNRLSQIQIQPFEYQKQIKNIVTNHEILQHKQLTEHRKNSLCNRDFSCMERKYNG